MVRLFFHCLRVAIVWFVLLTIFSFLILAFFIV